LSAFCRGTFDAPKSAKQPKAAFTTWQAAVPAELWMRSIQHLSEYAAWLPLERSRAVNMYRRDKDTAAAMKLSLVQSQAIQARMALIVGAKTFDRIFAGVEFDELDGDVLFVSAMDEDKGTEMEEKFGLAISVIAAEVLQRPIDIVVILPRVLQ
jgi:hypothetical protein